MKSSIKSVLAENNHAMQPAQQHKKWISEKPMLCWKCQKDKPRQGGKEKCLDGFGGKLRSFVCQDCLEAKKGATK